MLLKRIPTIFKALVLVLVLANGVYWAYTQGWGASWGWAPANPSELQRLKAQVQPDALKVVSAVPVNDGIPVVAPPDTVASSTTPPSASAAPSAEASSIQEPTSSTSRPPEPSTPEPTAPPATPAPPAPPAAPAVTPPPAQPINRDKAPVKPSEAPPTIATSPAPTSAPAPLSAANNLTKPVALACMQSQVLTKARVASVRQQLEGLAEVPKTAWNWVADTEPERWIIYLGRFASEDALERKTAQLEKMELKFVVLDDADLSPGISVGMFKSQAEANQELNQLNRRGLRLARVIKWMNAYKGQRVVVAAMNPDWRKPLEGLGLKLSECSPSEAAGAKP